MLIIEIQNDTTGTERSANYKYTVRVNDMVVEVGTIKGHNTADGWRYLVTLIGTPPAFRSAIPAGVKVESLLTMRAVDNCPVCVGQGYIVYDGDKHAKCINCDGTGHCH